MSVWWLAGHGLRFIAVFSLLDDFFLLVLAVALILSISEIFPGFLMKQPLSEQLILVDEFDREMGQLGRDEVHRYPVKLHRAASVWLVNDQGEVLLQQRSQHKITAAGWWANAVCGNVNVGESYEECAWRRLQAEIGLEQAGESDQVDGSNRLDEPKQLELRPFKLESLFKFHYQAYLNEKFGENEIDQVFGAVYRGKLQLNPAEVAAVKWVDWRELKKVAEHKLAVGEIVTAGESLELSQDELVTKASGVLAEISGQSMMIAPWTLMMLQDQRLIDFLSRATA